MNSIPARLAACYKKLPERGNVLDIGCLGFRQWKGAKELGLTNLNHHGVDFCNPEEAVPERFVFRKADLDREPIPFSDDYFDLVVASHVIEHLSRPLDFFVECARVCRPGGTIYLEAPSERTLWFPGMPFEHDRFFSLSFFDDPTHVSRPWTPQALFRLCKYYSCEPIHVGYVYGSILWRLSFPFLLPLALLRRSAGLMEASWWGTFGGSSYLVARKPETIAGKPRFGYYIPPRCRTW